MQFRSTTSYGSRPTWHRETFEGEAVIRVRLLRPTTRIVLHAAELEIKASSVALDGQRTFQAQAKPDPASEIVALELPAAIGPGIAELNLVFSGILNRQLRGFYISEANGRKYAVTQLEATDARRMFPCSTNRSSKPRSTSV